MSSNLQLNGNAPKPNNKPAPAPAPKPNNKPAPPKPSGGFMSYFRPSQEKINKQKANKNAQNQALRNGIQRLKNHILSKNHIKKYSTNGNIELLLLAARNINKNRFISKNINTAYKGITKRSRNSPAKLNIAYTPQEKINAINKFLGQLAIRKAKLDNITIGGGERLVGAVKGFGSAVATKAAGLTRIFEKTKLPAKQQALINGYKRIFRNKNYRNLQTRTLRANDNIDTFLNSLAINKSTNIILNNNNVQKTKYNRYLNALERQYLLGNGSIPNLTKPIMSNNKRTLEQLRKNKANKNAKAAASAAVPKAQNAPKPKNASVGNNKPMSGNNKPSWNTVKKTLVSNTQNIDKGIEALQAILQAKEKYSW
jgi:hypothetical protein